MSQGFITKEGLHKLKQELADLQTKRRSEVAGRIKASIDFGDLLENAEYAEAKEDQAFMEGRIAEIENVLRNVNLVSGTPSGKANVQVGCKVYLAVAGGTKSFKIMGKGEGDPTRGEISSDSPIGSAVLGRRIGEEFDVPAPSGIKKYKIVRIA